MLRGYSDILRLFVCWEDGELRFLDPETSLYLPTHHESEARADEESTRADEESTRADAAEARVAQLEAELRRLRGE